MSEKPQVVVYGGRYAFCDPEVLQRVGALSEDEFDAGLRGMPVDEYRRYRASEKLAENLGIALVVGAIPAFLVVGLPWAGGPVLGVLANVLTLVAVVAAVRWSRTRAANARRAAEAQADKREEAAIQAEIDADEARRARLNTSSPVAPRRWSPASHAGRDEAYWLNGQGFKISG